MRDWCAILIDAGLRNLRAVDISRQHSVSINHASRQAKRYGVLLQGANGESFPSHNVTRTLRPKDWEREFAFAAWHGETLNQFCARVGVSGGSATKHASVHNHTFAAATGTALLWWRRQLALAEAGHETLNAFCRRTGKGAAAATTWAKRLGHTFAAGSKRTVAGRKARASRLANAQARA